MTGEVYCDICGKWIKGPVFWRGDVLACRECANDINSESEESHRTKALFLIAAGSGFGLVAYTITMPFFVLMLCIGFSILFLLNGVFLLTR